MQAWDPLPGRTRTYYPSGGCLLDRNLSPSRTWTCDPSGGHHTFRNPSPAVP